MALQSWITTTTNTSYIANGHSCSSFLSIYIYIGGVHVLCSGIRICRLFLKFEISERTFTTTTWPEEKNVISSGDTTIWQNERKIAYSHWNGHWNYHYGDNRTMCKWKPIMLIIIMHLNCANCDVIRRWRSYMCKTQLALQTEWQDGQICIHERCLLCCRSVDATHMFTFNCAVFGMHLAIAPRTIA